MKKINIVLVLLLLISVVCLASITVVNAAEYNYAESYIFSDWKDFLFITCIAVAVTGFFCVLMVSIHNRANKAASASIYMDDCDYVVIKKQEKYLRTYETVKEDFYKSKSND